MWIPGSLEVMAVGIWFVGQPSIHSLTTFIYILSMASLFLGLVMANS